MTTDKNIPATPETLAQTDELIASFSEPAPIEETLDQKVARLEAQIAEVRTGNIAKPIEQADGTTRNYKDLRSEHQKYMDEQALVLEDAIRFREDLERRNAVSYATPDGRLAWRPANYTERPLMTEDDAIREFGLSKWAALSPKQRAQAKLVTKSDVDRIDLAKVFGRTSTGAAAMELSSENPSLYRMAKRKAKKEGLI